jgi:hypothetical protein
LAPEDVLTRFREQFAKIDPDIEEQRVDFELAACVKIVAASSS